MTLEESVLAFRLQVLREAERVGNVSATCRLFDVSRTRFYEWRAQWRQYGADGLRPKPTSAQRGRPVGVTLEAEHRVLAVALAWPTRGPLGQRQLAEAGWSGDDGLACAAAPRPESSGRATGGRRASARGSHGRPDGTQSAGGWSDTWPPTRPGDLLSLDTFYIGQLKGVGKVWQITACDAACSYGWARVVAGEVTGAAVLALRGRKSLFPRMRAPAWTLRRVLTDRGKEFKARVRCRSRPVGDSPHAHEAAPCVDQRVRRTVSRARSCTEHWRLVFRRTYFRGVRQLQRTLDAFLAFYNRRRPHQGYRLRGRTPATLF